MPDPAEPPRPIYHLALRAEWEAAGTAGEYRRSTLGRSLEDVGFIHASFAGQVQGTADLLYRGQTDVVLLTVDPARLAAPVRVEGHGPEAERFPHIYGPIPLAAVVRVDPVPVEPDGRLRIEAVLAPGRAGDPPDPTGPPAEGGAGPRRRPLEGWQWRLLLATVVLAVASPSLPWATIGRTSRSGYGLARAIWAADLSSRAGLRAVSLLPLLPLLGVGVLAFLQFQRWRSAAATALVAGVVLVLSALSVRRAPLEGEPGSAVALGAGMLVVAVAVGVAVAKQRSRA